MPIIHTITLYSRPTEAQQCYICNTFRYIGEAFIKEYSDGIKYTYFPKFNILHIFLNPAKLLNTDSIYEFHCIPFIRVAESEVKRVFEEISINKLIISRIDFKIDFRTKYKDLYLLVFHKTASSYRRLNQYNKYETSVYFNSTSKNINIYDKQAERENKLQIVDEKYLDMLRIEMQMGRDYFKSQFKKFGVCENELVNYWKEKDRDYILNEYLKPIIFFGDYYTLYHSNRILKENYTLTMTNKLIEFQKVISRNGVSVAKSKYRSLFYAYKNRLEAVNINPIVIPKNNQYGLTHLPNLFNFTNENIYLLEEWKGLKAG